MEIDGEQEEQEEHIREACLHVNQARGQRLLCNEKIKAAQDDAKADKDHYKL